MCVRDADGASLWAAYSYTWSNCQTSRLTRVICHWLDDDAGCVLGRLLLGTGSFGSDGIFAIAFEGGADGDDSFGGGDEHLRAERHTLVRGRTQW